MARTVIPSSGLVVSSDEVMPEEHAVVGLVVDSDPDGSVQIGAMIVRGGVFALVYPDGTSCQVLREEPEYA